MANYKRWNDAELQYIKDNLASFSDAELAQKLSEMTVVVRKILKIIYHNG
jgi:hypothetical protein